MLPQQGDKLAGLGFSYTGCLRRATRDNAAHCLWWPAQIVNYVGYPSLTQRN